MLAQAGDATVTITQACPPGMTQSVIQVTLIVCGKTGGGPAAKPGGPRESLRTGVPGPVHDKGHAQTRRFALNDHGFEANSSSDNTVTGGRDALDGPGPVT